MVFLELTLNASVLLLPRLFKSDETKYMYVEENEPPTNSPVISFLSAISARTTPRCRITLDYVEVLRDEGTMDYVSILACLMSVYFIYSIEYADKLKSTLLFVQHHLLHMKEKESPLAIKRVAILLDKY